MKTRKRKPKQAPEPVVDAEVQIETLLKTISRNLQGTTEWQDFLSQVDAVGKQLGFHVTANLSFEIEAKF